jgi:hypothetical protein
MHKLMCIVLSAIVIALSRAIRVVFLHNVSIIVIGIEGQSLILRIVPLLFFEVVNKEFYR